MGPREERLKRGGMDADAGVGSAWRHGVGRRRKVLDRADRLATCPRFPRPIVPYIMGVMLLLWSGAGAATLWPMWRSHAWAPLLVPVAWLVAHAASDQSRAHFLQVSLLHTGLLFQVGCPPRIYWALTRVA